MKLLRFSLVAALAAVFGLSGTTEAGQREGAFSISPSVGYHVFDSDQKLDDTAAYGFSLGYNITKHWAVELDGRFSPTETDLDSDEGANVDADVWNYSLNALYHFNPDGPFVPYLTAGFGNSVYLADGYKDDEDFMLTGGVGAKYFFSEDAALRLDARYIAGFHSDDRWGLAGRGDNSEGNFIVSAGLYFQFGGVTPAPPPPADSDLDGIPDSRDKCPDTPFGTLVDAVGCPPVEKVAPPPPPKKPVDRDSDGDGVLDSRDKCPDTPMGVIVDEDGCPVKFTLQIEFDFDKSAVRPEYHARLKEAAAFINKYPETKFLLAGHTDSRGSDAYNKALSNRRAAAVKKYLVEEFGICAHLLYPRGYGESQPVASNETDEGRQRNRRVEVICCVIIPPEDQETKSLM
jgi:OOP family OmpA-OmpF porin